MTNESVVRAWDRRVLRPQHRAMEIHGIEPVSCAKPRKNVGVGERIASLAGGAALALAGRQKGNIGGLLLAAFGVGLLYRGATGHCYCYQKLGISTAERNRNSVIPAKQGVKVEKHLTINRPAPDLYAFWRDLTNLPRVFEHLSSVERSDGNVTHWVAVGPAGKRIEWDAEILNDHENELIAWRSLPGSQIDTAGSIRFQATMNGRGTIVVVSMQYNPPGGHVADYLASWFGTDLESQLTDDLRKFKSLMEAGEFPSTQGQPQGAS
jgi:uncharacterized membrane protein